ncbi:hypothetical protein AOQ84DRAFT_413986, partial [Glonium stellatum]
NRHQLYVAKFSVQTTNGRVLKRRSLNIAIILTGGMGKPSRCLALLLQNVKIPFLLASPRANVGTTSGMLAVEFDWLDFSTFDTPFQHKLTNEISISAIYPITSEVRDPAPLMNSFINHAFLETQCQEVLPFGW